jgi:uncharacterized protein (TIGR02246 family)
MKRTGSLALALVATFTLAAATATAQHDASHRGATSDSAAVVAVITKYHEALAAGDSAAVLALLTDDAVVLETGGIETREEYRSHHLPGDIGFAKAIKSQRGAVHVRIRGDVAWQTATSTTQGEMNGRAINSVGAELMVLVRSGSTWKIAAIHWSSRQRRAG